MSFLQPTNVMLTIRDEQMKALAAAAHDQFEVVAVRHLETSVPDFCAHLGPVALAAFVHSAVKRGLSHGLEEDYDLLRFVNLTYLLDPGFDENPDLPWAKAYLADREIDPSARLDLLCHHAEVYLDQIDAQEPVEQR